MLRVEEIVVSNRGLSSLTREVNHFIKNLGDEVEIVDIKYSMTVSQGYSPNITSGALILYKSKEPTIN